MIRVYLASQIFAECWRDYNEKIAQRIEKEFPDIELYVPQRNKAINDKTKCASAEDIAAGDITNNLDKDDIIVAIVDGDMPGIGTTCEIAYFARICEEEIQKYGKTNKCIISLYTDSREPSKTFLEAKNNQLHQMAESQYSYINLLLVGILKRYGTMCGSIDEVIEALREALKNYQTIEKDEYNHIMCEHCKKFIDCMIDTESVLCDNKDVSWLHSLGVEK